MRSNGLVVQALPGFIDAVDLAFCFAIESRCSFKQVVYFLQVFLVT